MGYPRDLPLAIHCLLRSIFLDKKCNELCRIFDIGRDNERSRGFGNGIIIYSDILLDYIKENYPDFYFISSTTKVLTDFLRI